MQCKTQITQLLKIEELGANQAQKDDLLFLQLEQDEGYSVPPRVACADANLDSLDPQQLNQQQFVAADDGSISVNPAAKIVVDNDPNDVVPVKK